MDDLPPVQWTLIASILGVGCILYALTDCACRWACRTCQRKGGTAVPPPARELTAQLAAIEAKLAQLEREWGVDTESRTPQRSGARSEEAVAAAEEEEEEEEGAAQRLLRRRGSGSGNGGDQDEAGSGGNDLEEEEEEEEEDADELDAEAEAQVRRLKEYFTQGPRTEAYRRWRAAQAADGEAAAGVTAVTGTVAPETETAAAAAARAQRGAMETSKTK